jgi:glycosyltransferase involved in cell wall biosynthesis
LAAKGVNIINIHVGTTVKRKIIYFIALCVYAKRLNSKKLIFTLHDVLPFEDDKKLVKLLKVFYSLADYFTVGNDLEKKKLIKYFEIPESKIDIIPHGIYNLFDRNLYTQAMARGYLDIPRNKKVVLFFGFLREYKGLDYLIKAASILSKKPDINFLVYVASALKYAPRDLVERCLELINKLNLQEKFVLNLNYLDSLDIEATFKASDLVVLPYTYASQSGVLNMAMGFKKPVVVTDAFYDKMWIENKAGSVARSKDSQSLAQNIEILLRNDRLRKRYGEYGFKYASKHFNWDRIAKKYANVYHKIAK